MKLRISNHIDKIKEKYKDNNNKSISLHYLDVIFKDNFLQISNDDDLMGGLMYLGEDYTYKIEYFSYIILFFPNSHKSFLLSINEAYDFQYIEILLQNYANNNCNSFSINSIKKYDENRFLIKIPSDLYLEFSNKTFKSFQSILNDDFIINKYENIDSFPKLKEQINKLLLFLGIKGNVFPGTFREINSYN
jgi:hypothetical protein